VIILNRSTGATSDPRVVKRKAVGQLAFEARRFFPTARCTTATSCGRETIRRPAAPGVPADRSTSSCRHSAIGRGPISDLSQSPFASGQVYASPSARAATSGRALKSALAGGSRGHDAHHGSNGNISLRTAALAQHFTGYYRPEDMDLDSFAFAAGSVSVCWTNTGAWTNGGNSASEGAAVYGEVLCLSEHLRPIRRWQRTRSRR